MIAAVTKLLIGKQTGGEESDQSMADHLRGGSPSAGGDSALPSVYQSLTSAMPSAYQSMTEAPSEFTERTVTEPPPSKGAKPELRDFTPKVWDARLDKMSPAYSPAQTPSMRQAHQEAAHARYGSGQFQESIVEGEEHAHLRRSNRDSWEEDYDSRSATNEPRSRSPSMPREVSASHPDEARADNRVAEPYFDRVSDLASDSGWERHPSAGFSRQQSAESQQSDLRGSQHSYFRESQQSHGGDVQQLREPYSESQESYSGGLQQRREPYRAPTPPSSSEVEQLMFRQPSEPGALQLHVRVISVADLGGKGRTQDVLAQPIFCRLRLLSGDTDRYTRDL